MPEQLDRPPADSPRTAPTNPAILETLALAEALMQGTDDFVAVINCTGEILEVSEAVARRLGRDRSTLVGCLASDLFPPEVASRRMAAFERVKQSCKSERFEDKNGCRYFDHILYPILGPDGRVAKVVSIAREITERKLAEEALRQSETRYRMLHETMRDAFVQVAMDGRIMEFNDVYCQMLGYSPEELRTLTYQDLTPERWHEFEDRIVREQIVARGYSEVYEKEYRRKDGTIIPIELRTMLSRDERGEPVAMWGIIRDITERKRMDEALKAIEEKHRHLLKYSPAGFFEMDFVNGRIKNVSNGMCNFLGYTVEEFMCMNPLDLTDEEGRKTLLERIRSLLAGEKIPEIVEYRITAKDGRKLWTLLSNAFIYEGGQVTGSLVMAIDITQRKKMEQSLRESEERFRTLSERSLVGVYLIQGEIFRYVNPAFADVAGYGCEEIIDRLGPEDFLIPEDTEAVMDSIRMCLSGKLEEDHREFHIKRKDGSVREVETYGVRIMHAGSPAILGTLIDITERKQMEKALLNSRDELEIRVEERTAELERKNRELRDFAFIASHDLNEPLRKIQTLGSLLVIKGAEHLTSQERDYISRITGAADRMRDLLDALLSYSGVETRGEEFRPTNLSALVRSVIIDLEVGIREAKAQVKIGNLPTLPGDPHQLRQLFQNLIGNALKYRCTEGTLIQVYAEEMGRKYCVSVEDNGIGFDEKYLDKIFQPFQQLHGRNEYPGIGIGLAICKKIVERHSGTISAKSTPGKGSTFMVTLPLSSPK